MEKIFDEIIQSPRPVLIDFFATWCGPCRAMAPVLSELGAILGNRISIVEIDVDQHTDLAVKMRVMGVPTFMIYKNGRQLWSEAGTFTLETLKKKT